MDKDQDKAKDPALSNSESAVYIRPQRLQGLPQMRPG
jgi:hypothetical protein